MPFRTAESGVDKRLDQLPGLGIANHKAAKADDVHAVVFHTLVGGKVVMNQGCTHSGDLVGDYRCPYAAAAKGDAPFHIAADHGPGQWDDEIRVVISRGQRHGTEISYIMT